MVEKKPKKDPEEVKEIEEEIAVVDETDEVVEGTEDSFGFGEITLNLTTNKQTIDRGPKNLEESLEDEVVERAAERRDDQDYNEDNEESLDEETDERDFYSESSSSDFYNTDSSDEGDGGPYSVGERKGNGGDFYKGGNTELYSGVNQGVYISGNGGGNGSNFYDPRQNKDNPQEKGYVKGVRFNSGLEHKSKKAKRAKMGYDMPGKNNGAKGAY